MTEPDVDPRLLAVLVCPLTRGPLRYDRVKQQLISDLAGLAYPVRQGVPVMLVDEALPLEPDPAAAGEPAAQEPYPPKP